MSTGVHQFQVKGRTLAIDIDEAAVHDLSADSRRTVSGGRYDAPCHEDSQLSLPPPKLRALILHLAHDCNMRCDYCFSFWPTQAAGYGDQHLLMSADTAKAAVDFFLRNADRDAPTLIVSFFGGEPLLNKGVLMSTVKYIRSELSSRRWLLWLTTNGTLLTPGIQNFLINNDIGLLISIDGDKVTHDRMRHYLCGGSAHGIVLRNALSFAGNANARCTVRGTFMHPTIEFADQVTYLADQGFRYISMEPGSAPKSYPSAITTGDLQTAKKEFEKLATVCLERFIDRNPIRFFYLDKLLSSFAFPRRKCRECGAGAAVVAVSPEGDVFPCHRLVGHQSFRLGNVSEDAYDRSVPHLLWNTNVGTKEKCRSCWARFICGGGCHADAVLIEGDLNTPYNVCCDLMKHRIEVGAWLYTELRERNYELFEDVIVGLRAYHSWKPQSSARVELHSDGDRYFVDSEVGIRVALNATSAKLWQACDGNSSLYDMARQLHREYGIDMRMALDDVRNALLKFSEYRLVDPRKLL